MPHRLQELDALRGLAALGVLFCHFASACHRLSILPCDFPYGAYGPHLFFMISGFVILMALARTERAADFIVSRFSRLYPVYWISIAATVAVLWAFPNGEPMPTPKQVCVNLSMLQTWLRVPDLQTAYWTLGVELKFYFIMFLIYLTGRIRSIEPFVLVWLGLIAAYRLAAGFGTPSLLLVKTLLIADYGHLFAAGVIFYQIKMVGHHWTRHALLATCLALQLVAKNGGSVIESSAMVASFFGLFYLFVGNRLGWIAVRPMVYLGTISYSLYLIHGCIGNACIPQLPGLWRWPALAMGVPLLLSLLAAALITHGIEQPALRLIRNLYKSWRPQLLRLAGKPHERKAG
jgi:peptidoglycan/LPS O-acetylase OafA/YrhL